MGANRYTRTLDSEGRVDSLSRLWVETGNMMVMMHAPQSLQLYRSALEFLQGIATVRYGMLRTDEFFLPLGEVRDARVFLERTCNQYVMTYRRDRFCLENPLNSHLCSHLKGAVLSSGQLRLLQEYEEEFSHQNISFVVYQKPLVIIQPQMSPLSKLYSSRSDKAIS